ncbi:MAG TPA: SDR family oxidoreductase [Candidatus Krumholzibacteria bacterium]|nr:SDR family oxidoreductase [Candidatus Krumholzibacteria bacterium]
MKDSTALVTGGSRGIGRAAAVALAQAGARHVVIGYVENEAAAHEACREVDAAGAGSHMVRANLAHPAEIDRLFDDVRARLDRIDIFVHCAALAAFKPLMSTRQNQWDLTVNINARAFLLCVQQCAPLMVHGGSIVAVSSLGSSRVMPAYGAMGPTKAALESLVRGLAVELGPRGIRVNAVSAGLITGTAAAELAGAGAALSAARARTPLARDGEPGDLAGVIAFLAGSDSGWITGQTIVADGGYSLS